MTSEPQRETCERCGTFVPPSETTVVGQSRVCLGCAPKLRAEFLLHPFDRLIVIGVLLSAGGALWLLASNVARLGHRRESYALRVGAVVTTVLLAAVSSRFQLPYAVRVGVGAAVAVFPVLPWKDRFQEHLRQGAPKAPLGRAVLTIVAFGALAFAVNRTLAALGFNR